MAMRFYKADKAAPGGFKKLETKSVKMPLRWGYVPSVTTILGVIQPSHISEYLIRQCLEHYQAYGDYQAALRYRDDEAAEFGTDCHALLEARLKGTTCNRPTDIRHEQACAPLWQWLDDNVQELLFCEQGFADKDLGYGGTADLLVLLKDGRQMLLDLKTKKHSPHYPIGPDMYCRYQLSAYRKHFEKQYGPMGIANLFLASPFGYLPQPRLVVADYGQGDWSDSFEAAHRLWREQWRADGLSEVR